MAVVIYWMSLSLVAVYRLSPCPRSLHFAIWSTMGNLTTHGWLTALHHQLIDRASVSFFYWPNQNGVEPTWPLCLQALSPLLLSFSHIFSPTLFKCSRGHESYSLLRIHTSGLTNQRLDQPATPLSSPASFLHSSTLTHSVLHNFLWFRLLAIEANVSSLWFKWVFCFFVYWIFFCILTWATDESVCWRYGFTFKFFFFYLLSVFIF